MTLSSRATSRDLLRLALLLFLALPAHAQISPGPLSQPHAKLEGAANCFQCHEAGKGVTAARCLTCHKELRARVAAKRGLHAQPGYQKCERCHNEHHGRAFQLIRWTPKTLDHRVTGFPLLGAHAKLECRQCHKTRSFLGLSQNCASCHRDPHKGQFGTRACTSCHAMTAWKPPSLFTHAKTSFPLTGKHAQLACAKCHANGVYRPIKHQRCTDCHKDPHANRFGPTCTNCHSTSAFKPVNFDHAMVPKQPCTNCHKDPHANRFGQNCANCHSTSSFKAVKFDHSRIPKQPCVNCHKSRDAHAGRLGTSCERCHATTGWRPAKRENFDHAQTRFPLTGKHRAVACASCHRESSVRAPMVCSSCHKDPHAGRLGTTCNNCHSTTGWKNVTAGAFDHDKTRFRLKGAHKRAECASCHERWKKPPLTCTGCHKDPHAGQFGAAECTRCHSVERFLPSTFTVEAHQKAKFPLAGAHLAVPCNACHAKGQFRLAAAATECQSCHKSPHGTAVTGKCTSCHRVESWSRITFDHRTFPLEGAHAKVRCAACHTNLARFQGVPRSCAGCHGERR